MAVGDARNLIEVVADAVELSEDAGNSRVGAVHASGRPEEVGAGMHSG